MSNNWENKKVAVLGLGVEGVSSARFLVKKGARVTVLDRKKEKEIISLLRHSGKPRSSGRIQNLSGQEVAAVRDSGHQAQLGQARMTDFVMMPEIVGGDGYLKGLNKFDVIVRSPGVRRNLPELIAAEKKGTRITSQTKIFFDLCPCPIIGVTGTKGKGTTSALIYEMLKEQGFDAYLGGNIGKPPLDFLNKLSPKSWVVLELSSFQLQDITKSPHIAVVLMITSEHLDYHKDTKEYVEAKRNILRFQAKDDFAIINRDYPASRESNILTKAEVLNVSRESEVEEGCFVKDGMIVVSIGKLIRHSGKRSASRISMVLRDSGHQAQLGQARMTNNNFINQQLIIDINDILLPGKHNLENVCAAVMAATLVGVSKENIVKVLETFKGLEHRLELVREINGVRYYDDSFSTTPETAIAAIQAFENPEILILGGSSKGSDFRELGLVISNAKNIKAIIGIGAEWPNIKYQISNIKYQMKIFEGLKDMKSIVKKAAEIARSGDVVLLSPACASFDMFKNYKNRGEQFKKQVLNLENPSGK